MAFIEKGQEIDIEAIKAETQLSAEALQHKENRDQELADILSGKDDRILLVIGHFFLQVCQTTSILKYCFFIVRRTRPNDQKDTVILT